MAFSVRRAVALGSAILIWLAALLQILQFSSATAQFVPPPMNNGTDWEMDPTERIQVWTAHMLYEKDQLAFNIFIGIFLSFGTFGLAYCVLCLKKIYKKYQSGRSDLPDMMLICFLFGSLMVAYEFIASLGSEIVVVLASIQTLNNINSMTPAKFEDIAETIEISSQVINGRKILIMALLFILLSVGVLLSSLMSLRTGMLNVKHARLGFVTSGAGFICFITELVLVSSMLVETSTFAHAVPFAVFLVIFGLILMPIWTVWLGFELARLKEDTVFRQEDRGLVQNAV